MADHLTKEEITDFWRSWFTDGPPPEEKRMKKILRLLPSNPRCNFCNAPFQGIGAPIVKAIFGKKPSVHNTAYCNVCDDFSMAFGGGAEVEMAMLFADIRESTPLSEKLSPTEFSAVIERFYSVATQVLVDCSAFIDRLGGDEVIAYFGSGLSGRDYIQTAIQAGIEILKATGHADPGGPWVSVGVGVHVGVAFFGSVSSPSGMNNITALGAEVNTAARLASHAEAGEVIVSQAALTKGKVELSSSEKSSLTLKGVQEPVAVETIKLIPNTVPALVRQ
jgi:adenylate cyclase